MSLTSDTLAIDDTPTTAYVLLVDGYDIGFTDTHEADAMTTAWGRTIRGGLDAEGEIRQSAKPFDAKVQTPRLYCSVLDDDDDTLARLFLREVNDDAITDALADLGTSNMDSNDVTMLLGDASLFPASGTVYVDTEEISYTSNGGSLLGGLTRGLHSLFGPDGSTNFGQPHRVDRDPTDPSARALFSPQVSTVPREWVGRTVALYLCVRSDGVWTANAQAECIWAGTIAEITDDPENHRINIECAHILERLRGTMLRRQFRGRLEEGYWLTTASGNLSVKVRKGLTTDGSWSDPVSATTTTLIPSDELYTHAEVATLINTQLDSWFDGTPFSTDWDLSLAYDASSGRYKWSFTYDGAAPGSGSWMWLIEIKMSRYLAYLLGYEISWEEKTIKEGPTPVDLSPTYSFHWYAPMPPLRVAMPAPGDSGQILRVTPEAGEYVAQYSVPAGMPSGTTMFVRIAGKTVLAVAISGTNQFTVKGYIPEDGTIGLTAVRFTSPGYSPDPPFSLERVIADGLTDEGVLVEQVWFDIAPVDDLLRRLLLSTGTAGYNHATYDTEPEQVGLGLPFGMIDAPSFDQLGSPVLGADAAVLYLPKPTEFLPWFEAQLQMKNLHAIWHRGKIRIVGFGEAPTATLTLTEGTKRQLVTDILTPVLQISKVRRTLDFLVNRLALRYNIPLGGSDGRQPSTFVVVNTASGYRTKQNRPVTVDALGRYEELGTFGTTGFLVDWIRDVAAPALAYFGSHLCVFVVTYGLSHLLEMYPGRQALVDDDRILHPRSGERGVAGLACWCIDTRFNIGTSISEAIMVFNPRTATRQLVAVAQALETDLAQTMTHRKTRVLGQSTETELAQDVTPT